MLSQNFALNTKLVFLQMKNRPTRILKFGRYIFLLSLASFSGASLGTTYDIYGLQQKLASCKAPFKSRISKVKSEERYLLNKEPELYEDLKAETIQAQTPDAGPYALGPEMQEQARSMVIKIDNTLRQINIDLDYYKKEIEIAKKNENKNCAQDKELLNTQTNEYIAQQTKIDQEIKQKKAIEMKNRISSERATIVKKETDIEDEINSLRDSYIKDYCKNHAYLQGSPFNYNPYSTKGKCFFSGYMQVAQIINRHEVLARQLADEGDSTAVIYFKNNPPPVGQLISGALIGIGTVKYESTGGELIVSPLLDWSSNKGLQKITDLELNLEDLQWELAHKKYLEHKATEKNQPSSLTDSFAREIQKKVYSKWGKHFNEELSCIVKFHLSRDGKIIGLPQIIESSGNPRFNEAVIETIKNAAPFTPPEGLPYRKYMDIKLDFNAIDLNH